MRSAMNEVFGRKTFIALESIGLTIARWFDTCKCMTIFFYLHFIHGVCSIQKSTLSLRVCKVSLAIFRDSFFEGVRILYEKYCHLLSVHSKAHGIDLSRLVFVFSLN